MQSLGERRRSVVVVAFLCALSWALFGCGGGLTEGEVLSRLETAGLTVERLDESLLTNKQRQRIENPMELVFSAKVSDASGNEQTVTFIQFKKEFMAAAAAYEGVPGFAVGTWYFAGVPNAEIRTEIEAALK